MTNRTIQCPECKGKGFMVVTDQCELVNGRWPCRMCRAEKTIPDRRAPTAADMAATEERATMKRAVDSWGRVSQFLMLVEECSELALAAVRVVNRNRPGAEEQLCEEVADVEIMCAQVRAMGFSAPIDEYKREKIARLKDRIVRGEESRNE